MLSFIIPTLNEENHIGKLLSSLKPQLAKGDEIVVVDSYSKDNTAKIAKGYGARVVKRPKKGIGLARTSGAKAAKNDIVVFLDADCKVHKGFVKRLRKHFRNPKILAVGGLDLYHSDCKVRKTIYNAYSKCVFHSARLTHAVTGKYWLAGNNCAFKRGVFFSVGGYRSVICEDTDLMVRMPPAKDIVYDSKMVLTLSDRRFRKEGFVNTVKLWGWSNIASFVGDGLSDNNYRED